MTCLRDNHQGAELLIGYLEGSLPEADRRVLDGHAAECSECRELLAVQAMLDEPVPAVSADFDAKLYARIAADEARRPWWKLSWKVLAPAVGVMAMLAVAVFVQQPVAPSPEQPIVSQDVQQLEQALEDLELLMPAAEAL
jgi:anti-sigma factor RsiW